MTENSFDFSLFVSVYEEIYCNLIKGDIEHNKSTFIKYKKSTSTSTFTFRFVDYDNNQRMQPIQDYTVLNEAERFQAALVYEEKYLVTMDEMIAIQQEIKNHVKEYGMSSVLGKRLHFNIDKE